MKIIILCTLLAVVAAQEATYNNRYDNIDVEEILKSDRLFKNYFNCLMDAGPCTPEGTDLKKYLPDALETGCTKCTEKQRDTGNKVIAWLIENRPMEWTMLKNKYDPENKLTERYRELAAKAGIAL
ncbi:AAEL001989-PA [Aedes aegypti]|uniref:AAEL001989-PA n=2 Tax=Aedes aegypti TaxID=7159 RepID=A0A1S4F0K8_AEDAE|nr:ejaculatory bulb-specific protein 3 [Aedes aegypti]EAT46836.1 AAEL001989-PA [Aedes aegypti]